MIHLRLCFPVLLWQKGTKAPQAAGKIHTDFEKGFIMAEVMKYADFKEEGTENAVKVSVLWTRPEEKLNVSLSVALQNVSSDVPSPTGRREIQAAGQELRGRGRRHYLFQIQHTQRT